MPSDMFRNVFITDINPKYVWGGDAITIDDADMIWIDHVTVRLQDHLKSALTDSVCRLLSSVANTLSWVPAPPTVSLFQTAKSTV